MYFCEYTQKEKEDIAKSLKLHKNTEEDFLKFKQAVDTDIDKIKPLSPIGLNFIESFVHVEILNTKSKQGISFFDFWYNKEFYMNRDQSTKNLVQSIQKNKPYLDEIRVAKQVFNLYCGSISIFRPTNAARLYKKYSPTCVLDFTMGWGGRLLGAVALDIQKYVGIDSNTNLAKPYSKMIENFKNIKTDIDLRFQNSLEIDYSSLDYDMVFTSPPFYNKEIYRQTTSSAEIPYKSKEEWDEKFYIPIFSTTWEHLKPGGHYCLNVPEYLYEKICIPIFGEAMEQIELKKYSRCLPKKDSQKQTNVGQKYKEYIYVWIKS